MKERRNLTVLDFTEVRMLLRGAVCRPVSEN